LPTSSLLPACAASGVCSERSIDRAGPRAVTSAATWTFIGPYAARTEAQVPARPPQQGSLVRRPTSASSPS
jgi:hypothetical protein